LIRSSHGIDDDAATFLVGDEAVTFRGDDTIAFRGAGAITFGGGGAIIATVAAGTAEAGVFVARATEVAGVGALTVIVAGASTRVDVEFGCAHATICVSVARENRFHFPK
jgi:hypothetical protein